MKPSAHIPFDIEDYQSLVNKLANFIELRFGVYLDITMSFQNNVEKFIRDQQHTAQLTKLSMEKLDKVLFVYGNGPTSSDLKECK